MSLRVVVTEDDPHYRAGLVAFFESEPGFEAAAVFSSAEQLLSAAETARFTDGSPPWDIAVLDVELPGMSGFEAAQRLKRLLPDLPIVMLTVFEDPAAILQAICAGADGYLLKKNSPDELAEQLGSIAAGGSPLTPGVARIVLDLLRVSNPKPATPLSVELSDRELSVLRHLARGLSYKQAAEAESISLDTVRTYVRRIYRKLQVHNVAEAVGQAIRAGLV